LTCGIWQGLLENLAMVARKGRRRREKQLGLRKDQAAKEIDTWLGKGIFSGTERIRFGPCWKEKLFCGCYYIRLWSYYLQVIWSVSTGKKSIFHWPFHRT
jgi:hypothetical protein